MERVGKAFANLRYEGSAKPPALRANKSTSHQQQNSSPLSILMIGSTGNGKSTLGNYLIDPRDESQAFRTARTNKPETQTVQCAVDRKENPSLRIVDTPGLNENEVKDLSHMIDIVSKLKALQSITACILCVKFESKIDAQYKATVAYYRKLLPSLFEGNVVIVMTSFLTDERTQMMRKKQGVDVDAIVRNAQLEVIESGELKFTPQVFLIDSVPVTENERRASENCRDSILGYIRQSLKPISIKDMKVAKTTALKQHDAKEIGRLDGEIHGYNMRLKEANKAAASVLNTIERKERAVTDTRGEIQQIKAELQDKNSTKTVTAKTWSLSNSWKWFERQEENFDISSAWPIVEYSRWDNGHLEWKEFEWSKDPGRAYGKVEGEWFRGLYANVTLLTQKREMFKDDIALLDRTLSAREKDLQDLYKDLDEYKARESEHHQEIQLLHEYIKERSMRKEELLADPIPIEEAHKRLVDLKPK